MTPPLIVHADGLCTRTCNHEAVDSAQVEACRTWLRCRAVTSARLNKRVGSYSLKHRVEEESREPGVVHHQIDPHGRAWAGAYLYVSNGAFIEAARLEGYRVQPCAPGSPNAFFNLTIRRKSVDVVHVCEVTQ